MNTYDPGILLSAAAALFVVFSKDVTPLTGTTALGLCCLAFYLLGLNIGRAERRT